MHAAGIVCQQVPKVKLFCCHHHYKAVLVPMLAQKITKQLQLIGYEDISGK